MADAIPMSAVDGLRLRAEGAGVAMACRYLDSREYEAALVAERRRAGAYRSLYWTRAQRWLAGMIAGSVALLGLPAVW